MATETPKATPKVKVEVTYVFPQFRLHYTGARFPEEKGHPAAEGDSIAKGNTPDLGPDQDDMEGETYLFVQERDPADAPIEELLLDVMGRAYTPDPAAPKDFDKHVYRVFVEARDYNVWHTHLSRAQLIASAEARVTAATEAATAAAQDKSDADDAVAAAAPPPHHKATKALAKAQAAQKAAVKAQAAADKAQAVATAALDEVKGPGFAKRAEKVTASLVMKLKSCFDLGHPVASSSDGGQLRELEGVYFYRGHMEVDLDGSPNAYAPNATSYAWLVAHYAPYFDATGKLNPRVDGKAVKGSNKKVWGSKGGTLVEILPNSFNAGQLPAELAPGEIPTKLPGVADGMQSANWHPDKMDKAERVYWDGIKFDDEGRISVVADGDYAGYFVPRTTHVNIDPLTVPGFAFPNAFNQTALGRQVVGRSGVVCYAPPGTPPRITGAIVSDTGGGTTGEGTPRLAAMLGHGREPATIPQTAHTYNVEYEIGHHRLAYVIFPPKPPRARWTRAALVADGRTLFIAWGGMARLRCCFPELFPMGMTSMPYWADADTQKLLDEVDPPAPASASAPAAAPAKKKKK